MRLTKDLLQAEQPLRDALVAIHLCHLARLRTLAKGGCSLIATDLHREERQFAKLCAEDLPDEESKAQPRDCLCKG